LKRETGLNLSPFFYFRKLRLLQRAVCCKEPFAAKRRLLQRDVCCKEPFAAKSRLPQRTVCCKEPFATKSRLLQRAVCRKRLYNLMHKIATLYEDSVYMMRLDFFTSVPHTYSWNTCFRQHKAIWILGTILSLLLSAGAGVFLAEHQCEYGDFYVFYITAQRFTDGESLYSRSVAGLSFLYTPFAAMLHAPLSLFSLKQASAIFSAFNVFALLIFYAFTFFWTQIRWNMRIMEWIIACIVTTYFFLINIPLVQNNIFLMLLCVFSLECFLQKKYLPAALLITVVALVKVYFIFIVIWMILRSGYRFLIYIFLTFLLCFLLTYIFRGYNLTWMDWNQYRHYVLAGATAGNIFADFRNQSLWAFTSRFAEMFNPIYYEYIKAMVMGLIISLLSVALALVLWHRYLKTEISLAEPAIFLCIAHLASYYTWNQHLVSLFLPACLIAVLGFRSHNRMAIFLLILYLSSWLTISSISPEWQKMIYASGFLTIHVVITLGFLLFILIQKGIQRIRPFRLPEP
jgi:hypothetical protein